MSEGVRDNLTLHALLDSIVAYGIGSTYRFFYIVSIEILLVIVRPYACIEIGLEF